MNRDVARPAVVFDLDDTLYLERDYVRSGYRAVGRVLRERRGCDTAFEDWLWDRFVRGESDRAFDALSDYFGLGLDRSDIAELVDVYRTHLPKIQPIPDVVELLMDLRKVAKLGLLSDGYLPAQELKFNALGLEELFDAVVFTENLGRQCWKPSTAGFQRVCQILDVPHEWCTYVADNPHKDFLGPNRLGWRSVHLLFDGQIHAHHEPPTGGAPADVVGSVDELRELLRQRGVLRSSASPTK